MEGTVLTARRRRLILWGAGTAAAVLLLRHVLRAVAMQLLAASLLTLLALPVCRQLEKRLPAGLAAALSLLLLLVTASALLLAALPPAVRQVQQLTASLPALMENLQSHLLQLTSWAQSKGLDLTSLRDNLLSHLTGAAGSLVSRAVSTATQLIGSLGKVLLSPLLAFYLLRDRRRIASLLTLLLPVRSRARGVRAAREMRRETAAYLRGQLLLSLSVGGMTALGLLLTGTPGWLILGVLMGVLELVPYIGPVIAGVPAVLLALQLGWSRALWTIAVLLIIQETEGAVLSPRLLGGATSLHPMAVLLLVSAGGILAGTLGMVLVIPAVVSIRGAVRGWRE